MTYAAKKAPAMNSQLPTLSSAPPVSAWPLVQPRASTAPSPMAPPPPSAIVSRTADDVRPRLRVKGLGDPDELEAILRRQDSLRDGDHVQGHREKDDREQTMAAGHRDPP